MRFTDVMLDRGLQALRQSVGTSRASARPSSSEMPDVIPRELIVLSSDDDVDDSGDDELSCSDDDDYDDDLEASDDGECESEDETVDSESCLVTSDDDIEDGGEQESDDCGESVDTPAECCRSHEDEEKSSCLPTGVVTAAGESTRRRPRRAPPPRRRCSRSLPVHGERRSAGGARVPLRRQPPPVAPSPLAALPAVATPHGATLDHLPLSELVSGSYEFVQNESARFRQYHTALQYRIWHIANDALLNGELWSREARAVHGHAAL